MAGVGGGLEFPAVMLAAGAARERYSALRQPGSLLSLGPDGWVQITNFVVCGLLMLAFAAGLRRAHRSKGDARAPVLIATFGVGLVGAGLFPLDPSYGYPPGAPLGPARSFSTRGILHEVAGYLMFGPLVAACVVLPRRLGAGAARRRWIAWSIVTGLVIVASIAAAFREWSTGSPDNVGGLFQRIAIAVGWLWVALVALRTMRDTRTTTSVSRSTPVVIERRST